MLDREFVEKTINEHKKVYKKRLALLFSKVYDLIEKTERSEEKISLEIEIPKEITTEILVNKMHTDKKSKNNKIRFVFMESIGKIKEFENGNFSTKVEDEYLLDVIERVRR